MLLYVQHDELQNGTVNARKSLTTGFQSCYSVLNNPNTKGKTMNTQDTMPEFPAHCTKSCPDKVYNDNCPGYCPSSYFRNAYEKALAEKRLAEQAAKDVDCVFCIVANGVQQGPLYRTREAATKMLKTAAEAVRMRFVNNGVTDAALQQAVEYNHRTRESRPVPDAYNVTVVSPYTWKAEVESTIKVERLTFA